MKPSPLIEVSERGGDIAACSETPARSGCSALFLSPWLAASQVVIGLLTSAIEQA
jgi:hypothetical protein